MEDKLLLAIGGATGSGKTALAVQLCHRNSHLVILSADSRQIYKQLDIGSAKVGEAGVTDELTGKPEPVWFYEGVPQFLIDIAQPNTNFTVADYQKEAYRLIHACWERDKIPLLVGGTGLYIEAVVKGFVFEGRGHKSLRLNLADLSVEELQAQIVSKGVEMPASDFNNKRRLIRALERLQLGLEATGKKMRPITENHHVYTLTRPWEEQRALAPAMVEERLNLGLLQETEQLIAQGINREWLCGMGLSYRLVIEMLEGIFPKQELKDRMTDAFRQLMRRQCTWFKNRRLGPLLSSSEVEDKINTLLKERIHSLDTN